MQFNQGNRKYKTLLCRHFEKNGICQLGERCGFAHGQQDLRKDDDPIPPQAQYSIINQMNQIQQMRMNSMQNYKTTRCSNFDQGYCKNGQACMFAHGEDDIRPVQQNMQMMQQMPSQMGYMGQYASQQEMMNYQLQQQMMYQQHYQMMNNTQNQLEQIRQSAMINIIQQLGVILKNDIIAVNKLNQATQFIYSNMLDQANQLVQEVMQDPNRTEHEIEQYTQIFNQTQESLNKQQQMINQQASQMNPNIQKE